MENIMLNLNSRLKIMTKIMNGDKFKLKAGRILFFIKPIKVNR